MISVFGSANMDLVAYTPVVPKRGETVTGRAFAAVPGGKGANQAVAAARAGADVAFMGAVGDDAFGPVVRETLGSAGVDVSRLRVVPGSSGVAHIVVDDDGGNSIIVVPGANGAVTAPSAEDLAVIARSDALLLQLELPMEAVVSAARQARVPVVLTPAPARELPRELLDAVDLIVPNEHEAEALTGLADPREALEALLELVPEAVITLGAEGALYGSRAGGRLRVPAVPVRAVDTTAAGDTFVGALAVARAEGRPQEEALRFAAAAAALSVQREGASTSMPGRAEIDAALR
ncbi:ribokinase [Streptosporangium sandarakinum]|uniref:Ribokinase n=1 Tax=Streptosporangium sandarakinum TaxID=1260955 RepID=A0A852UQY9_9ACTN|nr:ribokinase [Streptosporangium sandarakinum]NYF39947.1 ribokinase [Streptosporangium sandarakinum]